MWAVRACSRGSSLLALTEKVVYGFTLQPANVDSIIIAKAQQANHGFIVLVAEVQHMPVAKSTLRAAESLGRISAGQVWRLDKFTINNGLRCCSAQATAHCTD